MMLFLEIGMPTLGLLLVLVGIRDIREARRIRRDVAELWRRDEAGQWRKEAGR